MSAEGPNVASESALMSLCAGDMAEVISSATGATDVSHSAMCAAYIKCMLSMSGVLGLAPVVVGTTVASSIVTLPGIFFSSSAGLSFVEEAGATAAKYLRIGSMILRLD